MGKNLRRAMLSCAGCTLMLFVTCGLAFNVFSAAAQPYVLAQNGFTNTQTSLITTIRSAAYLLGTISANVNLSTSYLCRVFKSEVGTSITSYLNNLRIRKAATLIKENTFSLKEISVMVGIDDQLYFSRLFKKCMGISPSEYGKRFHL